MAMIALHWVLITVTKELHAKHVFADAKQLPLCGESKPCCSFFTFEGNLDVLTNLFLYSYQVFAHLISTVVEKYWCHQTFVLVLVYAIWVPLKLQISINLKISFHLNKVVKQQEIWITICNILSLFWILLLINLLLLFFFYTTYTPT